MAYQNVGTPRFIIDYLSWHKAVSGEKTVSTLWNGSTDSPSNSVAGLYPTTIVEAKTTGLNSASTAGFNFGNTFTRDTYFPVENINIIGAFGHNFGSILNDNSNFAAYFSLTDNTNYDETTQSGTVFPDFTFGAYGDDDEISINSNYSSTWYIAPIYDGWSLQSVNGLTTDYSGSEYAIKSCDVVIRGLSQNASGDGGYDDHLVKLGSILVGRYYTMPHSPELKLTMTREMDGVKRVRTKGGNDLVHHKYLKSPMWGDLAPWELSISGSAVTNQKLARVGRRVWDLSFNYMQGSDMFGSNESLGGQYDTYNLFYAFGQQNLNTQGVYDSDDLNSSGMTYNILTDDNFFSQVLHKTNGGQLPFIFQPDSNNNNPDQFAICKLDMNSFKFDQISPNLYRVKLKIREVW